MKNMKIKAKLLLGFTIVAIITAAIGFLGGINLYNTDQKYSELLVKNSVMIPYISTSVNELQNIRLSLNRDAIVFNDVEGRVDKAKTDIDQSMTVLEASMAGLRDNLTEKDTEELALLEEALSVYNEYKPLAKEVLEHAGNKDLVSAKETLKSAAKLSDTILDRLTQCQTLVIGAGLTQSGILSTQTFSTIIVVIVIVIASFICAIMLGVYIARIISMPVNNMTKLLGQIGRTGDMNIDVELLKKCKDDAVFKDEIAQSVGSSIALTEYLLEVSTEIQQISEGDLTVNVNPLSEKDSIGIALKLMVDNLNNMFGEISDSTEQVSAGSMQVADGSQALAQGATEQATAVEELSGSIANIASKTKVNTEQANTASKLANTIKENAEKGSVQMENMMQAVKEISEASISINKVIKVIDDIAFQTNILALNAAVEAARAGQHGKGFAVVAEEVRNLAAKSAEAAKDTSSLITNSIEKAQLGSKIAEETSKSLSEIVDGVSQSTVIVKGIAISSEEQSEAINQINTGIDQVAQVVSQNSATAEESAAASEELSGQATILEGLISQFKLKGKGSNHSSIRSKAPKKESHARTIALTDSDYGKY